MSTEQGGRPATAAELLEANEGLAKALAGARLEGSKFLRILGEVSTQITLCIADGDLCKLDRLRLADARDRITKAIHDHLKTTPPTDQGDAC